MNAAHRPDRAVGDAAGRGQRRGIEPLSVLGNPRYNMAMQEARLNGPPSRLHCAWPIWAASIAIVIVFAWRVAPMVPGDALYETPADHHKYLFMAEHGPWSFHIAPFCWRPGVPFVVGILPIDPQWGFRVIAMLCLAVTGVLVYQTGRAFGKEPSVAAFGMLAFFGVGWAVKNPLCDFYLPDAAAQMVVWLAVYLILKRRWGRLALALCLGVLVKESVLFVAPLAVTLADTPMFARRMWIRAALVVLPAVAIFLAIRVAIPQKNGDAAYLEQLPARLKVVDTDTTQYGYGERVAKIVSQRANDWMRQPLATLNACTFGAFGVLSIAMLSFDPRRNKPLLLRLTPFLVLVYAQLLFATDTQRLLVLGLPALILPALNGVERAAARLRRSSGQMLILSLPVVVLGCVYADRIAGPTSLEAAVIACGFLILTSRRGMQAGRGMT